MLIKKCILGGTVAQAVAPTIYGLQHPRGHGFKSDPLSFPDPTPHLFSPSHFLSKPSLSYLNKGKKPKNKQKTCMLWIKHFLYITIHHITSYTIPQEVIFHKNHYN